MLWVKSLADWTQTANTFLTSLVAISALIVGEIVASPHLDPPTIQSMYAIDIIVLIVALIGIPVIWNSRRPKLEVTISARGEAQTRADPQHTDIVTFERRFQALNVKAKNSPITKLQAKVTFDGNGPFYFGWVGSHVQYDDPSHIDLVAEEQAGLPIWEAGKEIGRNVSVTLQNTVRPYSVDNPARPEVVVEVQFIGENYTEKKSRKFNLNLRSWDDIGLTD